MGLKIPVRFSYKGFGKMILSVIWTCFFVLVSYVIVEGGSEKNVEGYYDTRMQDEEQEYEAEEITYKEWKEQDTVRNELWETENFIFELLELESPFFQYAYEGITETEQKEKSVLNLRWNLARYLEEEQAKSRNVNKNMLFAKAEEIFLQKEILQEDFPFLEVEGYFEDETTVYTEEEDIEAVTASAANKIQELKESKSMDYLLKNFYIVDSTTSVDSSVFKVENLLKKDMTLKKSSEPQILIYHTHGATEGFVNERT